MLVKCPITHNNSGYFEILKQYDIHLNLPVLVFLVHISEVVHQYFLFSGPNAMEGA